MTFHDSAASADTADLAAFGYPQQLHRALGSYAAFAAGFSFVSILTTVFQLFFFGFSFGGASFFWTWPIVFAGQMLVALCFAELASRYPISGCIYQWSQRLTNPTWGWFAGWIMIASCNPGGGNPIDSERAIAWSSGSTVVTDVVSVSP